MMHCQQFQDRLPEYLDGELPAGVLAEARTHLEQCGVCRQAAQAHEALADRFWLETKSLALRPGLAQQILAAVAEPPAGRMMAAFWTRVAWPAAIAAALAVAAYLIFVLRIDRQELSQQGRVAVSIELTFAESVYTFQQDGDFVIDSFSSEPSVVKETLRFWEDPKSPPVSPERKSP